MRRVMLAAAFVIVACKKPVAQPLEPHDEVAIAEPHDAGQVLDAAARRVFRVIGVSVKGAEFVVELDGGSENGITEDWTGCVVKTTSSETCIEGGDVVIIRVGKDKTLVTTHVSDEVLLRSRTVRLAPR
jgi:hypothetical protein